MAVDGGRPKRKQQPGEDDEGGSPSGLLTMAGMQTLLAAHLSTQTKELQAHQTVEIGKAVKAMEERTTRQIEHVRQELQKEIRTGHNANAEAIDKLQDGQDQLRKRLAALENREPSTTASMEAGEGRRQAVILGGWPRDTPRLDILADVKAMAADLDVQAELGDYFVPGQRSSICICPFEGGGGPQDRGKMLALVGKIQTARIQTEHLADGKHVERKIKSHLEDETVVIRAGVGCSPVRPGVCHRHPLGEGSAAGECGESSAPRPYLRERKGNQLVDRHRSIQSDNGENQGRSGESLAGVLGELSCRERAN